MNDKQVDRILAFKAIEQQVTTPLKPDMGVWHNPTEQLPALGNKFPNESMLVLCAIDGDFTIGFYHYETKQWNTDLGTLDSIIYWAYIPDLP